MLFICIGKLLHKMMNGSPGMFDVQKIDQMVQHDLREQPNLAHMLFNILTIGIWYSMYNNSTAPRPI